MRGGPDRNGQFVAEPYCMIMRKLHFRFRGWLYINVATKIETTFSRISSEWNIRNDWSWEKVLDHDGKQINIIALLQLAQLSTKYENPQIPLSKS